MAAWWSISDEMPFDTLFIGFFIGLAIAAPVGPINLIVLRTALSRGFAGGLFAGLGSVLGDGCFASVAAFGVRQIEEFIMAHATWLGAAGGLILIFVGIRTSRAHVDPDALAEAAGPSGGQAAGRKILSTFVLTVTNPATMMGMLAIFGTMGAALELATAPARAGMTVLGVMLGSLAWWAFISGMVGFLRTRINGVWLDRINHGAGILIVALGLVFLFDALAPLWG
ncbi:MAG: LysE family transporter [Rhizobiales bacterium]|nr:LysE family transporter [Hyphomicrobiales bacterium]